MATNTTLELVQYYQSLLITQYRNQPNASGTIGVLASMAIMPQTSVQTVVFSIAPTSGTFILSYNGINTASINWNDSAATIQGYLQAITGLESITVLGSIASLTLTVTFTGVVSPALSLVVFSNLLFATSVSVAITITETDEVLPLAVQDSFNLVPGTPTAVGVQLDTLGKYAGVTRSGQGFTSFITLDDVDFYTFIQMAIAQNSSGSSLSDILNFMFAFFGTNVLVYDNKNMTMTFFISTTVGTSDVLQLLITQGRLPVPMAVRATVFLIPVVLEKLFAFQDVRNVTPPVGHGFTTAQAYDATGHWLSTTDVFTA